MPKNDDKRSVRGSFCGKHQDQVSRIIAGPGAYICNECVQLCMSILDETGPELLEEEDRPEIPDVIPPPERSGTRWTSTSSVRRMPRSPSLWRCTTTISGSTSAAAMT